MKRILVAEHAVAILSAIISAWSVLSIWYGPAIRTSGRSLPILTSHTCTCFWIVVISSAITILPQFARLRRGCSTPRRGGLSPLLRRTGFSRHFPGNGAAPVLHWLPAALPPNGYSGQVLGAGRHKRRHGGRDRKSKRLTSSH